MIDRCSERSAHTLKRHHYRDVTGVCQKEFLDARGIAKPQAARRICRPDRARRVPAFLDRGSRNQLPELRTACSRLWKFRGQDVWNDYFNIFVAEPAW